MGTVFVSDKMSKHEPGLWGSEILANGRQWALKRSQVWRNATLLHFMGFPRKSPVLMQVNCLEPLEAQSSDKQHVPNTLDPVITVSGSLFNKLSDGSVRSKQKTTHLPG